MPSGWSPRSTGEWSGTSLPAWSFRPRTPHGRCCATSGECDLYVDSLGVGEAYRRRGVGARLMDAVEEWGRDRGAVRSVLTTYHASPLSVPFYERRMGYARRSIVFEKRLD
jgi:GNAT superfamily N-acetyltransferase